jgi:hypothetical protein
MQAPARPGAELLDIDVEDRRHAQRQELGEQETTDYGEAERLAGVTAFVRHLESTRGLGAGVDPVAAADACWVLTAPEVYRLCTAVRGWTGDAYEAWLTRMLTAAVLGP